MSYRFTWAHPASQVFVTGSFDNWSKSVELTKTGDLFEKTVPLPNTKDKILYKFVVDNNWVHDHTANTTTDHEGNVNNVLYPSDLTATTASSAISSVAPTATTTTMAGEQPLATPAPPGAFPETPGFDQNKQLSSDATVGEFSVNPIAASSGPVNPINLAQGEPVPNASTLSSHTLTSQVHDDPELVAADRAATQTFSVAPIPATSGIANPINLAHGESVPHSSTITSNTVNSNVRLDKASYEKSDAGAPVLPPALSPQSEREAAGASIFGLGPQVGTAVIPEAGFPTSTLTAADTNNLTPNISSVAPTSTTNQLAGAVPLQPRGVPEIVGESQEAAHVSPEAAANPEAVVEKSAVEQELKSKVPEEPATSESGLLGKSEKGYVGAAAAGLATAGVAAGAAISSVVGNTTTNNLAGQVPKQERGVPEVVSESQHDAHVSPEAAANPEAVREKTQVERELQAAVPKAPATSESGLLGKSEGGITGAIAGGIAAAGAAAAGTAYALREKTTQATGTDPVSVLPTSLQQKIDQNNPVVTSATITDVAQDTGIPQQYALGESVKGPAGDSAARQTAGAVPAEVSASQKEAHVGPEASANAEAVREKQAVEQELLSKIRSDDSQGQPAPVTSAALSATAPGTTTSTSGAPQLKPISSAAPIDLTNTTGLNASADSPAVPTSASKENKAPVSGDVSPLTNVDGPTVTTGVATARAPNRSTPEKRNSFLGKLKGTPESTSADSDGKTKRKSFFGKLKDKLSK